MQVAPAEDVDSKRVQDMLKSHHIESSMDFFDELQQMVHLAPGMRLVYRTNFAGMYNHISQASSSSRAWKYAHTLELQVVYFHNPKFARQPQLPLKEILFSAINTLPLINQLFPDVLVFYDDDPRIPFLCPDHENDPTSLRSQTIDEFVRPKQGQDPAAAGAQLKDKFAWLICCSSVFLLDLKAKAIWASNDQTLTPLVALLMANAKFVDDDNHATKACSMDLSTAHGHVSFS